jgi:hypothetical protein
MLSSSAPLRSLASRAWPVFVAVALSLFLGVGSPVEAYTQPESRYVNFCCQSGGPVTDSSSASGALRFSPCFETQDVASGRQCRVDQTYYYPVAVRTDRTFSFNNVDGELTVYPR